jgi:hypothetical protein
MYTFNLISQEAICRGDMIQEGALLKQVIGKQAIIYKVSNVEPSSVQVLELCTISDGKMLINYRKRL